MVWTKEERAVYMKKYRKENKEKISEKKKKYDQENKEGKAVYNKKYKKDNKEKIVKQMKEYDQTPAGKKSHTMSDWRQRGSIDPDMDEIYDKKYLPATHCQVCKKEFKNSYDRCMDHDHETGLFRQVLCRSCNNCDSWKSKLG
jgi:hypothetical protein